MEKQFDALVFVADLDEKTYNGSILTSYRSTESAFSDPNRKIIITTQLGFMSAPLIGLCNTFMIVENNKPHVLRFGTLPSGKELTPDSDLFEMWKSGELYDAEQTDNEEKEN